MGCAVPGHPEDRHASGGVIGVVEHDSPAYRAGVRVGEILTHADGAPLSDVLDWRWHADGGSVSLCVIGTDSGSRDVVLDREPGESWGIDFADAVFDTVRTCDNACAFCFVAQLPPGMRPALYVRDDDFRLSFMQGNFITLTNLTDADVDRIVEQGLSPLYVSIHATDPAVRRSLICAREDRALQHFDRLTQAGIDLHVQIVLLPDVNDGDVLERTLTWLAEREGVASVGIVPVGFTKHQRTHARSFTDPIAAATVIQQVQCWQFASRERDGLTWVHLADEFYLNARAPFPTTEWYDGFPQYENGIGMVRSFGDDAAAHRDEIETAVNALPAECESATLVTGVMAATTLAGALNAFDAAGRVRLLVVPNSLFGGNVSVTGLLTGADLVAAMERDLAALDAPTAYLVPDVVFNDDGLTLDDMDLETLRARSGGDVRVVSSDAAGVRSGLADVSNNPPGPLKE